MGRIQLANSAQAASRANREARIAAHGTPPSQSETRLKFSATHCRHVLQVRLRFAAIPRPPQAERPHTLRERPLDPRTPRVQCRPASLSMNDRTSRSAACCASVGTFKCRPCFNARVHCGRTGQSRQSEALNRIETSGLRSASVYSFHPMLNRPRGQRPASAPSRSRSPRRPAERPFHYPTTRQPYPLSLRLGQ